jgi:hypothetical protein
MLVNTGSGSDRAPSPLSFFILRVISIERPDQTTSMAFMAFTSVTLPALPQIGGFKLSCK